NFNILLRSPESTRFGPAKSWHAGCNAKCPEGGTSKEPAGLASVRPWVSCQFEHRPRKKRRNPKRAGKAGAQFFYPSAILTRVSGYTPASRSSFSRIGRYLPSGINPDRLARLRLRPWVEPVPFGEPVVGRQRSREGGSEPRTNPHCGR